MVVGKIQPAPAGFMGVGEARYCLEFWNPVCNPEKFAWKKVIQMIQASKQYRDQNSYALIVDAFLPELRDYHLPHHPIVDDFCLPDNFDIFYASSDVGTDLFPNKLLALADKEGKKLRKFIVQHKHELGTQPTSVEGCTFFRFWQRSYTQHQYHTE